MAKVILNPMFEQIRGDIGDLVLREVRGKTIVSRKPTFGEPTADQMAQRERFKLATAYGKAALADPVLRPLYEAAAFAKNVPVFALTVADFFNPPSIAKVDASGYNGQVGGTIEIITTDDFGVANVEVVISNADEGTVIERGQAVEDSPNSGHWSYTATINAAAGILAVIQVTAKDRPGNSATQRGTKQL